MTPQATAEFKAKWQFISSCDEPHSIDSYDAIRIVKEDLKLINGPGLFTHFYPGWNAIRNRTEYNTIKHWIAKAQPEPFHFYYIKQKGESASTSLNIVKYLTHEAGYYLNKKDFYFTADNWKEESTQWDAPEDYEMRGYVMLALQMGCKGVFYEPFYHYSYVTGLTSPDNTMLNSLGRYVSDSINTRLNGALGNTLMKYRFALEVSDSKARNVPDSITAAYSVLRQYSGMSDIALLRFDDALFPLANENVRFTRLENMTDKLNAIMAVNYGTQLFTTINFDIHSDIIPEYSNFRFFDPEKPSLIYPTNSAINELLARGDGRLFEILPIVRFGGSLIQDETIAAPTELKILPLRIPSGVTLIISSYYDCYQSIIVEAGGQLVINGGGQLTFHNGVGLVTYGDIAVSGGTIDFESSSSELQNGIKLFSGATAEFDSCTIQNGYCGISVEGTAQLKVTNSTIRNCVTGINLYNYDSNTPKIVNTLIENCSTGISAVYGNGLLVKNCTIRTSAGYGVYLQSVDQPLLIDNTMSDMTLSGSYMGVFALQSRGRFRDNHITNYGIGIYLAESAPRLFGNTLEHNFLTGLYLAPGAHPVLSPEGLLTENSEYRTYAIAGTNTIRENGLPAYGNGILSPEITVSGGALDSLEDGYNNILDDRLTGTNETSEIVSSDEEIPLSLTGNYWGNPIEYDRFPNCLLNTGSELTAPSLFTYGTHFLEFLDDENQPVDTVYEIIRSSGQLSGDREKQARAEYLYYLGNSSQAVILYTEVLTNWQDISLSLDCGTMTVILKKELQEDLSAIENFLTLRDTTVMTEAQRVTRLYLLSMCERESENYMAARNSAEQIMNTAGNPEQIFFAQQDTLLTGMLEQSAQQTNRMVRADDVPDQPNVKTNLLTDRLSERLQRKFGIGTRQIETVTKPTEYLLAQNYPNPFNPSTTIRFSLPERAEVTLAIYNQLGQNVTTLLSGECEAGYHSVEWNAGNFPSGVYLCELRTEKYRSVKKLVLVK